MSDAAEHNETAPQTDASAPDAPAETVSRKERNAARRAEFEAQKASKAAEKAAAKEARRAERAAHKEAKKASLAQAKAEKQAEKTAKKGASTGDRVDADAEPSEKPRKERKKAEKTQKDPYRPRFATAPTKVRAFTVLASVFALVHLVGAFLLLAETTSSPILGAVPEDVSSLAYVGSAIVFAVAVLWAVSASLLCAGRLLGRHLGVAAFVLGLPFTVVVAPMLFSNDVRDWAL